MVVTATRLVDIYRLPIGRSIFALRDVRTRAKAVKQKEIAQFAGRGIGDCQQAMDMALRVRASHDSKYPPEARAADGVLDRCVGGVAGYLDAQMRIYPDEPGGEAAERLHRVLFPGGVGAVTSLPYAEEHSHINTLLKRVADEDLADDVAALPELPGMLTRLRERNDEYGALLRQYQKSPTRDQLRDAEQKCQERMAETVALIIGHYAARHPDKLEERDHLLKPILHQNEAVRLARRRRRAPSDIDPDTGQELGPITDPEPDPTGPLAGSDPREAAGPPAETGRGPAV